MPGFRYEGQHTTVFTWAEGDTTWDEVFSEHGTNYGKHLASLVALLERLGDVGRLKAEQFHAQGNEIFAVKGRFKFRAYGWFEQVDGKRSFVIGQVAFKKEDKADPTHLSRCVAIKERFRKNKGA